MGRAGDGGYLSAAVRAEWRLVAADEGTENGCDWGGMGRDVARLDSTRGGGRALAEARGMGNAMAHSVRLTGGAERWPGAVRRERTSG